MDTSETYVKMCDCLEIQGQRGNLMHQHDYLIDCLWLPRQEDIQEMILCDWKAFEPNERHSHHLLSVNFNIFVKGLFPDENHINSMTEFWIMFYMNDIHKKKWSDEKGWIAI